MSKVCTAYYGCRGCGNKFSRIVKNHELPDPLLAHVWMKVAQNQIAAHICHDGPSIKIHGVGELLQLTVVEQ